ncbi:MAG TPA: hypothetical protein VFC87_00730 [Perlabentimonas sp.]|jgi:hypothetical protein|nr:hypothetical protein [Bacteroidales bacterium]MDD4672951.1 hypothetical protein [Bacteroidales bacterium]HZJ73301.1 hypothetical protein [Perlabentimonas sp.]
MSEYQHKYSEEDDFKEEVGRLIGEQKFNAAINYLLQVIEYDRGNTQAKVLLEQIRKINQFQNREIFAQTNLDMDPWFE